MSTRYIPPKSTIRQKKLQWMNLLCHIHDMQCDCPAPLEHTICLIAEQEPQLKFKTPEIDLLKKCLTTPATDGKDGDQDGFGEGDLEDLFKEDFGDENTG